MAKLLSRSTASRVATRFFSTSMPAAPSRSNLTSRRYSPTLSHAMGFIPADTTRLTTIRTRMDRSGGWYSPLDSGCSFRDQARTEMESGRDYEHWIIVMDKPGGENASRQQMIDCYVQTLAKIVGSEEEAKRKMYNVSCERFLRFGCEIDEETSKKLEEIPGVLYALPDSYVDPEYKDYGGELFMNGEVVPRPPERQRKIVELTTQRRSRNARRRDYTC